MRRILIATDFSTRSDRALRRGSLLARQVGGDLILVHVVDDDRPRRLVEFDYERAQSLLHDLVRTFRDNDGIECRSQVVLGDPFQGLCKATEEVDADFLILGPHRRQILRDTFFGTTAERTVRNSSKPVLMANALPTAPYRIVVVANDFSESSAAAAQAAKQLGILDGAVTIAIHVLDDNEGGPILLASMTVKEAEERSAAADARAAAELDRSMRTLGIMGPQRVIKPVDQSVAMAINSYAMTAEADLIVLGTHGRIGVEKWILGSVAESVLSHAEVDVLAVPRSSSTMSVNQASASADAD